MSQPQEGENGQQATAPIRIDEDQSSTVPHPVLRPSGPGPADAWQDFSHIHERPWDDDVVFGSPGGPRWAPPAATPSPRRHPRLRKALFIVGGLVAALIALSIVGNASQHPKPAATVTRPPAVAPSSGLGPANIPGVSRPALTCQQQYTSWRDATGGADLGLYNADQHALFNAAGPIQTALDNDTVPSQEQITAFQTADIKVIGVAERIQFKDPPPSCLPSFRSDYIQAMRDSVAGGSAGLDMTGSLNTSDIAAAQASAVLVGQDFTKASTDLTQANHDLSATGWH